MDKHCNYLGYDSSTYKVHSQGNVSTQKSPILEIILPVIASIFLINFSFLGEK